MTDSTAQLRYGIYAILLVIAAGNVAGRIATVESPGKDETPFLSANDRSRWATVRALVDEGTFAIDEVIKDRGWDTIDKVWHRGHDGQLHFYSSKPPLLSVSVAGVYWIVQQVTGATLETHPHYVGRILLALTQLVPLMIGLFVVTLLIERYGTTDWGRIFAVACTVAGTQLVTFGVTFSNHVPAAVALALSVYFLSNLWIEEDAGWWNMPLAGFFTALTVAGELPALAFAGLVTLAVFWRFPTATLVGYVPAALVVAFAAQYTNYLAHGSWLPAYSQRGEGTFICELSMADDAWLTPGPISPALRQRLADAGKIQLSSEAKIVEAKQGGPAEIEGVEPVAISRKAELRDLPNGERYSLELTEGKLTVRTWADWYDYDGSYWREKGRLQGVDRGEPSIAWYAVHATIGHHGIFSLTPIWTLTVVGLAIAIFSPESKLRHVAMLTVTVTLVCLLFYIFRPQIDRNYGGVSCTFRWMLWLHPLWLLGLVPAADRLAENRAGQITAYILLAISAFSVFYAGQNPWVNPWPMELGLYMGWMGGE